MGIEFFHQFIDRDFVDPLLKLRWPEFLLRNKLKWDDIAEVFYGAFGFQEDSETEVLVRALERRTLRWTMNHFYWPFFMLNEVLAIGPGKNRCPSIWAPRLEHAAFFYAAGFDAVLRDALQPIKLAALMQYYNWQPIDKVYVDLSPGELNGITEALSPFEAELTPMFPWQTGDFRADGYGCLNLHRTKRFLSFLDQAWRENWPAPRLNREARGVLRLPQKPIPRFRDFWMAESFHKIAKRLRSRRVCLLSFFGT